MELNFSNKLIFFATTSIWPFLDYKFKYHINLLVAANSDDDYIQSITINKDTLLSCYNSLSNSPYGTTVDTAGELLTSLLPQLITNSNKTDYEAYLLEKEAYDEAIASDPEADIDEPTPVIPNEYLQCLYEIMKLKQRDGETVDHQLLKGKNQILA